AAASDGVGQGATFTVKLPTMIVHGSPDAGPREQPRTDRQAPFVEPIPRLDGIHVLAVDDEADSLSLLRAALEGAGASVTTSPSGPAALEAARARPPDVVIADISMPGMNGLQLIRALRLMDPPVRSTPAA